MTPTRATSTELIARAVAVEDDKILLVRERSSSWYFLPGGHVEPGEPVQAALLRELAEELGARASVGGLIGVVESAYAVGGEQHHELNLVFEVALGGPVESREEHLAFDWVPLGELADAHVRPEPLKLALLQWLARGEPFWHGL